MSPPKRRRWFSLSLRTLLIGMTLISVAFGWFLHHRREKIAEREKLLKAYPPSSQVRFGGAGFFHARLRFRDKLLWWELPEPRFSLDVTTPVPGGGTAGGMIDDWAWLRPIAVPQLHSVYLDEDVPSASLESLIALARRTPHVHLGGDDDWTRELLPKLLSENTDFLGIDTRFSDLNGAPNLHELWCNLHDVNELEVILAHRPLKSVSLNVTAEVLAHAPSGTASNLRSLEITFEWPDDIPEIAVGEYAWVQRCPQLKQFNGTRCDPALLAAMGRHLGGVESLDLDEFDATSIEQLASWSRLRHLTMDVDVGAHQQVLADRVFVALGNIPGDLESLEIDGGLVDGDTITLAALENLKRFPHLKRLRLDYCELTKEHIAIIADLSELEELSLCTNPLDDDAIQPLKRLKRLRLINLDGTDVSDDQFENIRGDWIQRPITFIPVVGVLPLR